MLPLMENTAPTMSSGTQSLTDISAQLDALRLQSFQYIQVMTAVLFKAMDSFEAPKSYTDVTKMARALITLDKLVKQIYAPPKPVKTRAKPPAEPKPSPAEKAIDVILPSDSSEPESTEPFAPTPENPYAGYTQPRNRHEARRMAKVMVQAMKKTATG